MKNSLTLLLLFVFSLAYTQNIIEWNGEYQLKLSDFQSNQTEINDSLNNYSLYSGSNIDFSYQMNSYEFMFTKNFNSKVNTIFNKKAATIIAPDSITAFQLVKSAQYNFDLCELYARKFRKRVFEEKNISSDAIFFQKIYNTLLQEMNQENARVMKLTDIGRKEELLKIEHKKVLDEIQLLSDYCKECKPKKKKNN